MRVLIAHSFYRLQGGEDRYVEQQLEVLGRAHEVELFARHNKGLPGGLASAARMTFARQLLAEAEEAITRFRPDIVHLHNAYPSLGPAVHLAAERTRTPLVMTVHNFRLRCPNGYMFTEDAPCRRCEGGLYVHATLHHCFPSRAQAASYAVGLWVHRFVLKLERRVALFIAPSEFVRTRMLEWGMPAERVRVVRNFTSFPLGSPDPGAYGMYLGRLSAEKGLDVLLRALEQAGDPPFRIVGDGPERDALGALAGALGLRNTEFLGQVPADRVGPLLARCRFVVFSSVWDENAPIAAMEAMAAARPLLVTRTGGLPELVAGGEGLECERGDVRALAASLARVVGEDELCLQMGARAVERARAELTPERHLERLEAAYEAVLATRAVSSRSA
jgi:glycosyltransferase involved in cell wall biosynthesis